jgi:isoquinoline 1-oxidoreductase alpha subunit
MTTIRINGTERTVSLDHDIPLLWILRDELRLTGTKYGCGVAQCGAFTVHIDGRATRPRRGVVRGCLRAG